MPCDFCRLPDGIDKLKVWIHNNYNIKEDINYCPICGESIYVRDFFSIMNELKDGILKPKEYVEIDGVKLEVERPKCESKAEIKPLEIKPINFDLMKIDPDNVCIDQELKWLDEMQFQDSKKKWNDFFDKMREKENGGRKKFI